MGFESITYLLGTSGNRGVLIQSVPIGAATLISQYKIKMPGYGGKMEKYAPTKTEDVQTVEHRFVLPTFPRFTIVQLTLIGLLLAYAWTSRKMNRAAVSTVALGIGLLHMYDHIYRVKRGDERLFFFPEAKKEGYCGACRK
jgi:hypothetical protein